MQNTRRLWTLLGVSLCVVSAGFLQAPRRKPIDIPLLIELHNQERAKEKLPPLKADPLLEAAAKAHAKDMGDHGKMSHTGSDGSTHAKRITAEGYKFLRAGENVAAGQKSSREVMKGWMNSPGHKENVLGEFTEIGAACYVAEDGEPYWCVNFAKPWPKIDPIKDPAKFIELLNQEREKAKAGPLKVNEKLVAAAMRHAREMAKQERLVSTDDGGKTPIERASEDGYAYSSMSGTASRGETDPAIVLKSLLESPRNSKALLGDFQEVGIGVATSSESRVPCWSILLGSPAPK